MANFLLPMIRHAGRAYELRNTRNGRVIADTVIPAFDSGARRKGLLGRDSFPDGSAMIIAPTNAIHTFWMRFPIDVLFVRRDGFVVKVQERVAPWRAAVYPSAYAVIELAAGALRGGDVMVGDVLSLAPSLAFSSDATDERFELGRLFASQSISESTQVRSESEV
jgi:uncharacterized membrane protein (UPF0127 family)